MRKNNTIWRTIFLEDLRGRLCGCRTTADRRDAANFSSPHLSRTPLGHRLSHNRIGPGYTPEKITLASRHCEENENTFWPPCQVAMFNKYLKTKTTRRRLFFFLTRGTVQTQRPVFDHFSGWGIPTRKGPLVTILDHPFKGKFWSWNP